MRALSRWAVVAFLLAGPARAATDSFDLHWFWDQRCSDCHGHAGEFAQRFLTARDGKLLGAHHVDDMERFLGYHGVPDRQVKAMYEMLLAQAVRGPRFKDRCGRCHDNAAGLVRDGVVTKDGVPFGRESGLPLAVFLDGHGRIGADEVPFFVDLLRRIEREVRAPY